MKDYAVVSMHEKGFWQIDVYWKLERPPEEGDVPDHFKTCKIGDPMETAIQWCRDWCMHAEVLIADDEEDEDDEPESPAVRTSKMENTND
jgi:hypothetical protein